MSIFSDNLKYLRSKKEFTQAKLAEELIVSRESWAKYEGGRSEPPYEILKRISHYFHVSIDILLSVDLMKIPMGELMKMGDNRILLPIMIDRDGNNIIEIVPHKAKAGYLLGYGDPEYIESLQHLSAPMFKNGKYRAFEIDGDSMPPYKSGEFVVGKFIESLSEVKSKKTYIIMTKDKGTTFKRVFKKDEAHFILQPDNPVYKPYTIHASDITEIWEYAGILSDIEQIPAEDSDIAFLRDMIIELRKDMLEMKEKLSDR